MGQLTPLIAHWLRHCSGFLSFEQDSKYEMIKRSTVYILLRKRVYLCIEDCEVLVNYIKRAMLVLLR